MFHSILSRRSTRTAASRDRRREFRPTADGLEQRIAMSADGNDVRSGALQVGTLVPFSAVTKTGEVGSPDDNQDYYRFTISGAGAVPVTLRLDNLRADLDLSLEGGNGSVIVNSRATGTTSEGINATLSPGSFFVRVFKGVSSARSNYRLTITQTDISREPNDSTGQAVPLGTLSGSLSRQGSIGFPSSDRQDFFKFALTGTRTLTFTLENLSADLDIELLNSQGQVVRSSRRTGTSRETSTIRLSAGTYFVRVFQGVSAASSTYRLGLTLA